MLISFDFSSTNICYFFYISMNFAQINSKCAINSQKKAYHDLIINNILHLKAFFCFCFAIIKKKERTCKHAP